MAARLTGANLTRAHLGAANIDRADLTNAHFVGSTLAFARLSTSTVNGAQFHSAVLNQTIFSGLDLRSCTGIKECKHLGPSYLDIQTFQLSGDLPIEFLQGAGIPNHWIEYLPSMLVNTIQYYSCFISYSSKDEEFALQLYKDLQSHGVRCWFAPEDMKIGARMLDTIDEAIRLRDKVVLILSEASIRSDWVEDEVTKAYAEDRDRKATILFPIRIDDSVFQADEAWARKLRDGRNIGDFRRWAECDVYQKSIDRLLRALAVEGVCDPHL